MRKSDDENLLLADSAEGVDRCNTEFYGRFPYPWPPATFPYTADPGLHTSLLNQNLGRYRIATSSTASIWVAGCGTNQAVYTALRFPRAQVLGSDLSAASLEICATTAKQLGVTNLELRRESLNQVDYVESFDYVISTGVIHHNSDPAQALGRLRRALKRDGVLELMVYNRYHRLVNHAFQKAVRLLLPGDAPALRCEDELGIARLIMSGFKVKNLIGVLLDQHRNSPIEELADDLLQPVEHSYTVESLNEMAAGCGLEILSPCINEHDQASGSFEWHIDFEEPRLQAAFEALDDLRRWQVANLLLLEKSPMLWFYAQRTDSARRRRTEAQINEDFLDTVFVRTRCVQSYYRRGSSGTYSAASSPIPFPSGLPHAVVAKLYQAVDGRRSMREIFESLQWPCSFTAALRARIRLATSAFPFLIVSGGQMCEERPGE